MQSVFLKRPKTFTNSCINVHCHILHLESTKQNWKSHKKWTKSQSNVVRIMWVMFHLFKKVNLGKSHKPIGEATMMGASHLHTNFRRQIYAGHERDYALLKSVMIQKCSWIKNLMLQFGAEEDFSFNKSVSSDYCCNIFIQKNTQGKIMNRIKCVKCVAVSDP